MIVRRPLSLLLFIPLALCPSLAEARGGHMGGGFGGYGRGMGIHGAYGRHGLHMAGQRHANSSEISTYAVVEVTSTMDAATITALTTELIESLSAFNGRLVSHDANPGAVDGVPPAAFFLIAFKAPGEADGWRASQSFKDLEIGAQKTGARIFTVNALPGAQLPEPRSAAREEEERAYQKLINKGDDTLKKLQDICRGC